MLQVVYFDKNHISHKHILEKCLLYIDFETFLSLLGMYKSIPLISNCIAIGKIHLLNICAAEEGKQLIL